MDPLTRFQIPDFDIAAGSFASREVFAIVRERQTARTGIIEFQTAQHLTIIGVEDENRSLRHKRHLLSVRAEGIRTLFVVRINGFRVFAVPQNDLFAERQQS